MTLSTHKSGSLRRLLGRSKAALLIGIGLICCIFPVVPAVQSSAQPGGRNTAFNPTGEKDVGHGEALLHHLLRSDSFSSLYKPDLWNGGQRSWGLFDSLVSKLLSPESAKAIKIVRKTIGKLSDYGVVDVFKKYPTKDVAWSIVALARLQAASAQFEKTQGPPGKDVLGEDSEILHHLAYYAVFANAAYGWAMDLALRGRLHLGDLKALLSKTGIQEEDVVETNWTAKTHLPAYFIVRDSSNKNIVLCIRGTLSARDVLTDLCCAADDFETEGSTTHRAHSGMLEAARGVDKATRQVIKAELEANPDYSLVVVGHSLGGGVAAVLGTLWEQVFPGVVVYAYGSPCVGPINAEPTTNTNIISVVGEGDPFSCLSLGHIADISRGIAHLCQDEEMRNLILIRTERRLKDADDLDLKWSWDCMAGLRKHMDSEKLYPPGRVFYLSGINNNHQGTGKNMGLREVPHLHFQDLRLHPRMFDISKHVPSLYEALLQDMCNQKGSKAKNVS